MANFKNLFRKASLTLVDGLLLVLCAASLAYLSLPFLARSGAALGNAVDTGGDIRVVGVFVFVGILFLGVVAVFLRNFCYRMLYFRDLTGPRQAVHTDSTYGRVLAGFHRDSEQRSAGIPRLADPSIPPAKRGKTESEKRIGVQVEGVGSTQRGTGKGRH